MSLIFLIGMPGVGKSHWGRIWAEASGYDFADLDDCAAAQAGMSIPEIFRSIGEEGFRALETAVLGDAIATAGGRDTLIATGGGTPVFNNNMDLMLESGCVVYLRAGIDRLLRQITGSLTGRPLLHDAEDGVAALKALQEQRKAFYERAHISIELEKIRTDTFAQIIHQCTSRQL